MIRMNTVEKDFVTLELTIDATVEKVGGYKFTSLELGIIFFNRCKGMQVAFRTKHPLPCPVINLVTDLV